MADGEGVDGEFLLLPMPRDRKFLNVRKGVLPPLLDVDGLVGAGRVGLPLTEGYREGGMRPRLGDGSALGDDSVRGLMTGIWEARWVSVMSAAGPSLEDTCAGLSSQSSC